MKIPLLVLTALAAAAASTGALHAQTTSAPIAYGVGSNFAGVLGDGTRTDHKTPVPVASGFQFRKVRAAGQNSYGISVDGRLFSWGLNRGLLGFVDDEHEYLLTPQPVPGVDTRDASGRLIGRVLDVAAGVEQALAAHSLGGVYTWGRNVEGQLGNDTLPGDHGIFFSAVPVLSHAAGTTVASGYNFDLSLDRGSVLGWGSNGSSMLGLGPELVDYYFGEPQPVPGLTGVKQIAAGYLNSMALLRDGTVRVWGLISSDVLIPQYSPEPVAGLTDIVAITAGADFRVALRRDGTVWTWGVNSSGQLGDGTTTYRPRPVQVKNLTGVVAVASSSGSGHTLALLSDGSVKGWGYIPFGPTAFKVNTLPVAVPGLPRIREMAVGALHDLFLPGWRAKTTLVSGEAAPALPGFILKSFGVPALRGEQLAFKATLTGPNKVTKTAIIGPRANDSQEVLCKDGDPAPGLSGVTFASFGDPLLNDEGRVAFPAQLAGSGVSAANDASVWASSLPGTPTSILIAREGGQPPGVPSGARFQSFQSIFLDDTSAIFVVAQMAPGTGGVTASNDIGLWFWTPATGLKLALREGQDVIARPNAFNEPEFPLGTLSTFTTLTAAPGSAGDGRWDDSLGGITVRGNFTNGAQAIFTVDEARFGSAQVSLHARTSASPSGRPWIAFGLPASSEGFGRAYVATSQIGIGGIFDYNDTEIASDFTFLNILEGTAAPGVTVAGQVFASFLDPVVSGSSMAFIATLRGTKVGPVDDTGIWLYQADGETKRLVAREGAVAPAAGGAKFAAFTSLALPSKVDFNDASAHPIFTAKLTGSGVNASNDAGLWAVGANGTLQRILRTGQAVPIAGTSRVIQSINILNEVAGSPGQTRAYSDGQVSCLVTYAGGQAILTLSAF